MQSNTTYYYYLGTITTIIAVCTADVDIRSIASYVKTLGRWTKCRQTSRLLCANWTGTDVTRSLQWLLSAVSGRAELDLTTSCELWLLVGRGTRISIKVHTKIGSTGNGSDLSSGSTWQNSLDRGPPRQSCAILTAGIWRFVNSLKLNWL